VKSNFEWKVRSPIGVLSTRADHALVLPLKESAKIAFGGCTVTVTAAGVPQATSATLTGSPTGDHFASWNGTAPIDASSGDQHRHRLSRAGNRRINRVLHITAIVQLRRDTDGRAYYRRTLAADKSPLEALRCLKPRLSR
jgi:hypothetical protein